jgi:hypothetical protein
MRCLFAQKYVASLAQKHGVTTAAIGARQVGQVEGGASPHMWASMQAAQQPWPHGARRRRPVQERSRQSSRQTAHVNLAQSVVSHITF